MLTEADFKTHIYPHIVSAIDQDDEGLLQEAIDFAEGLAKTYLNAYDVDVIFGQTGANRDPVLLGLCKDIAVLQFCKLSNLAQDLEFIVAMKDDAIAELGKLGGGKTTPKHWPLAQTPEGKPAAPMSVSSYPRRETSY